MQPRKDRGEEADVVKTAEGNTEGTVRAWRPSSSGVGEQGRYMEGSPRNLGGPVVSIHKSRHGDPGDQISRPAGAASHAHRSE